MAQLVAQIHKVIAQKIEATPQRMIEAIQASNEFKLLHQICDDNGNTHYIAIAHRSSALYILPTLKSRSVPNVT